MSSVHRSDGQKLQKRPRGHPPPSAAEIEVAVNGKGREEMSYHVEIHADVLCIPGSIIVRLNGRRRAPPTGRGQGARQGIAALDVGRRPCLGRL